MNEIATKENTEFENPYTSIAAFEEIQRVAKLLSASDFIPASYKGNVANTVVALEMAARMGASPIAVMQNLYVVKGNPVWSGRFVLSLIKSCGRYRDVVFTGDGVNNQRLEATEVKSGRKVSGPEVTMEMAKAEGWLGKPGSKWKTFPELMLKYRAASFFGKSECPELLLGMGTVEEAEDSPEGKIETTAPKTESAADELNNIIDAEVMQDDNSEVVKKYKAMAAAKDIKTKKDLDAMRANKHQDVQRELSEKEADEVFAHWEEAYNGLPKE